MVKLTAFFLATTVMIQSFNLKQSDVLKLPALAKHVIDHLIEGDSFTDFFAMHYGNKTDLHKNEHKEHKNLPFNHKNNDSIFTSVFFFESNLNPVKSSFNCFYQNKPNSNIPFFRFLLSFTIFQPPK